MITCQHSSRFWPKGLYSSIIYWLKCIFLCTLECLNLHHAFSILKLLKSMGLSAFSVVRASLQGLNEEEAGQGGPAWIRAERTCMSPSSMEMRRACTKAMHMEEEAPRWTEISTTMAGVEQARSYSVQETLVRFWYLVGNEQLSFNEA
jgi:hypothetical protein